MWIIQTPFTFVFLEDMVLQGTDKSDYSEIQNCLESIFYLFLPQKKIFLRERFILLTQILFSTSKVQWLGECHLPLLLVLPLNSQSFSPTLAWLQAHSLALTYKVDPGSSNISRQACTVPTSCQLDLNFYFKNVHSSFLTKTSHK